MEFEKTGFFNDYYAEVLGCYDNKVEQYCVDIDLDTDVKRFKFVSEFKTVKEKKFNLDKVVCKNSITAIGLKIKGNSLFQIKSWVSALDIYNEALMVTPTENVEDFAILLANRSAVLYHMKEYELAIKDIEMATFNYPKDKMYKIKERLARCYFSNSDFENSLNIYKEMIYWLGESSLPNDERIKFETDAQIMVTNLQTKLNQTDKAMSKLSISIKNDDDIMNTKLNDSVGFGYDSSGHFAKAKNDIKVGETILAEKPHCAVIMEKYCKTHCHHCFIRTIAPIVCPKCPNVIFCSEECKNLALSTYHKIECKVLPLIWRSGLSHDYHMALRIISQKPLQYFIEIKDELTDNLKLDDILRLPPDDYRTIFTLVRHENVRSQTIFLQYSIIANFLAYCLRQGNYFSSISGDKQIAELYSFIGGLILRNLQLIQYNIHGIFELRCTKEVAKTFVIGSGIYPTFARFNHSCNLSISCCYKGTSVYIHAAKNFKQGEVIPNNYGLIYNLMPHKVRQLILQEKFKFNCICKPCKELWPLYKELPKLISNTNTIRLKCSDGDTNCKNTLIIPIGQKSMMVKCNKCNQFTNIVKILHFLMETNMLKSIAQQFYTCGEYLKAAEKYCEIITILDTYFELPTKDYLDAQLFYCLCLNKCGNKNVHFKE